MFAKNIPWKIRFLIIGLFFMVALLIYSMRTKSTDEIAKISNLSPAYIVNNQMLVSDAIPAGVDRLFVCGNITTHGSHYLAVTLLSTDENTYFGKDDANEPFSFGDFCTEIKLHQPLRSGFYKIIIIDTRERVGELVFQVK